MEVVTTTARSELLPDVPTVGDFLPGYEASAGTALARQAVRRTRSCKSSTRSSNAAFVDPRTKAQIAVLGGTPLPGSPAGFGRFIAEEIEKWGKVVEFSGIKIKAE